MIGIDECTKTECISIEERYCEMIKRVLEMTNKQYTTAA